MTHAPIGYVETKDIDDGDLDGNGKNKEQFDRYKADLDNIIFTDYLDFRFYFSTEGVAQVGDHGRAGGLRLRRPDGLGSGHGRPQGDSGRADVPSPAADGGGTPSLPCSVGVEAVRIANLVNGNLVVAPDAELERFAALIDFFGTAKPKPITSPARLAALMAGKARLLSRAIKVTLAEDKDGTSTLANQMETFRKILIHDLKFIRLGQHYVEKNGEGVLAYISNNSFLDGITHRQMRKSLCETFDEIYVLNLHGNARKKETAPDGTKDENVFDIMQGVSINIFVKRRRDAPVASEKEDASSSDVTRASRLRGVEDSSSSDATRASRLRGAEDSSSSDATRASRLRPEDVFNYIYGVLHTPAYCEKYREFLKIDFPRIPYPKSAEQFGRIAEIGAKLVQVHLLKDPNVTNPFANLYARFEGTGSGRIEKVEVEKVGGDGEKNSTVDIDLRHRPTLRVYINADKYFDNVPQAAWDAFIGGYQPAQKWLKDRKGRVLTSDELAHYKSIIKALVETAKLTAQLSALKP